MAEPCSMVHAMNVIMTGNVAQTVGNPSILSQKNTSIGIVVEIIAIGNIQIQGVIQDQDTCCKELVHDNRRI